MFKSLLFPKKTTPLPITIYDVSNNTSFKYCCCSGCDKKTECIVITIIPDPSVYKPVSPYDINKENEETINITNSNFKKLDEIL